jgi:hypothetical protein
MKTTTKLWIGIALLIVLAPLGLIVPGLVKAGAAWGEWGADELEKLVGHVPRGLEKLSGLWNAPFPDYVFKGWEEKGMMPQSVAYIVSAVAGVAVVVGIALLIGKFLSGKDNDNKK